MSEIKILNKKIYELIAAGEVVSRPMFAVKELIENSIDGEAKSIDIEIENGGKTLIRVIDDGIGISHDDCRTAFLNHATSKIKTEFDLNSIKTLGFRGEALSSICSISDVELFTRRKNFDFGTHYCCKGGVETIYEKVNCKLGTLINVKNLFYNVPARLKFLKSDMTEANLIQDIVEKLAISQKYVAFSFKKNGKKIFQTLGNGNLSDAIYQIFGKKIFQTLIPVENSFSNIEVVGFVSLPIFCKSRGNLNLSFVNSRYVKSKIFKNGVDEAFKEVTLKGKFASFVLFLNIDSSELDVNVHPAKTEIRFINESNVLKAIYLAVKKAIDSSNDVFNQNLNVNYSLNSDMIKNKIKTLSDRSNDKDITDVQVNSLNFKNSENLIESGFSSEIKNYNTNNFDNEIAVELNNEQKKANKNLNSENLIESGFSSEIKNYNTNNFNNEIAVELNNEQKKANKNLNSENRNEILTNEKILKFKLVGELFLTYILIEFENKLIIIDKHAAHERIIYEKLKLNFKNFEMQILIKPVEILIKSNYDCDLILNNLEIFNYFGFKIEPFGIHNLLIRAVPTFLKEINYLTIFDELVENLKLNCFNLTPKTIDHILYTMACKKAVTANYKNSEQELLELVKQLYLNPNFRNCPHGRPIMTIFSKDKLDGEFKRK